MQTPSRRRAKLVKRRMEYRTPSPLLLPAPLYPSAPDVRFASVPLRSPHPISPMRPKFTAADSPTTLATHALFAAVTQADAKNDPNHLTSSETQQVMLSLNTPIRTRYLM
jgi:hypothetical protein